MNVQRAMGNKVGPAAGREGNLRFSSLLLERSAYREFQKGVAGAGDKPILGIDEMTLDLCFRSHTSREESRGLKLCQAC